MIKKKVLIIEDEEVTALSLELFIDSLGYVVTDCVNNYKDALDSINTSTPDIIVSDIIINGFQSGIDIAKEASRQYGIFCIFITAHSTSEIIDDIKGLPYAGYILKPYNKDELRIALELNLSSMQTKPLSLNIHTLKIGDHIYQKLSKKLFLIQKEVPLTKKIGSLLNVLSKSPNTYVSYETLHQTIYKEDEAVNLDKLRHLISRLRKIIGKEHVVSHKELGYCLKP